MRRFQRELARLRHTATALISPLGWVVVALALVCLIMFAWWHWVEMLMMAIVCLIILFASFVLSVGNTAFQATIHVSSRRVQLNEPVDVTVHITNPGTTHTTSARADIPMGEQHERFTIPMLAPQQSQDTSLQFTARHRAIVPIGPLMIRKGDPFGFMRREHEVANRILVYIHPTVIALGPLHAGILRDLEGNPHGDIVDDDLDFYGLREYNPGDDVRNVHWLSSARTGTLMIRQYEVTKRTDTSISLDVNPQDYQDAAEFELAVSIHASIGVQALREHRPLYMHADYMHAQPAHVSDLLDLCSGITPNRHDPANLAHLARTATPDASLYCFTVGSAKPLDDIRRMLLTLPDHATIVVMQTMPHAPRAIHDYGTFRLAHIPSLEELPAIMGALS